MKDLIKKILKEEIISNGTLRVLSESTMLLIEQQEKNWGCNLFPENSEDRDWCKCAMDKIQAKKDTIKNKIDKISELFKLPDYSDLAKNIKYYSKEDPFYKENRENLRKLQNRLYPSCPKVKLVISGFGQTTATQYLFVDQKAYTQKYNLINKLNTNYSALSYLLTLYRRDRKQSLYNSPFSYVFGEFFEGSQNEDYIGESPFVRLIIDYFGKKNNAVDTMKNVFHTIKSTSEIGDEAEKKAYAELTKKYKRVEIFSGDFSWVDFLGVDMMVFDEKQPSTYKTITGKTQDSKVITGGWIPVQVKNNIDACNNAKRRFCKSICMGKKNNVWITKYYDGNKEIRSI